MGQTPEFPLSLTVVPWPESASDEIRRGRAAEALRHANSNGLEALRESACQTARMAYHETLWMVARAATESKPPYHEAFWITMGTAAPVIILAAIVVFGEASEIISEDETFWFGILAAVLIAACVSVQGLALSTALESLSHYNDASFAWAMKELWVGLVLLAAATVLTSYGKKILKRR